MVQHRHVFELEAVAANEHAQRIEHDLRTAWVRGLLRAEAADSLEAADSREAADSLEAVQAEALPLLLVALRLPARRRVRFEWRD